MKKRKPTRCKTTHAESGMRCIEDAGVPHDCVFTEEDRQLRDHVYALYKAQSEDIRFYREEVRQ